MADPNLNQASNLLAALTSQLRGCAAVPDGVAPPVAILWTDPERHWSSLKPLLLETLPELLVLGEYDPDQRSGPAIWLRCLIDGALDEPELPADRVPIVYLPGVGRQDLRAGEACSKSLRPLVELQYRGTLWLQHNGYDWTATAFLSSPKALGLEVARDEDTREALLRALPELAVAPLASLSGRKLRAEDFDSLLASDVVRDLLRWMGDPDGFKGRCTEQTWRAFCSQANKQFGIDPASDEILTAGALLGEGKGPWQDAWQRFEEAPEAFPGIPELLLRSAPDDMFADGSRWPHANVEAEEAVRKGLSELPNLYHMAACDAVLELERKHGQRRQWVWTRLGKSPMARVLEPLAVLATQARSPLGGASPADLAGQYVNGQWQADLASWQTLALAPTADRELVEAAVRVLLEPWLTESARNLQNLIKDAPLPGPQEQPVVSVNALGCLVFVDGLRYDLGRFLAEELRAAGCQVQVDQRWSALPSVTASGKPAVTPAAPHIKGERLGETFAPRLAEEGVAVDARTLRKKLKAMGYQVLDGQGTDWPESEDARCWLETADIDSLGHKLNTALAHQLKAQIEALVLRVSKLFDDGWQTVRIVTDHGWLLLPGGLPKIHMPKHLTESRWARCAAIAGESSVECPTAPWYWNASEYFAHAPGVACFNQSPSYAHGGVSIQECLIPDLHVERPSSTGSTASIRSITWRGMRCFVEADAPGAGISVDLRLGKASGPSVVDAVKPLDDDGTTSVVVTEEDIEEEGLVLVLVAEDGKVLTQKKTRIGISS